MLTQSFLKFKTAKPLIFSSSVRSYYPHSEDLLSPFLSKYFHRYRFIVLGKPHLHEFSSMLFKAKPVYDQSFNVTSVEVVSTFDPIRTLLSKINSSNNVPMGFHVYPMHDNRLSIISPTGLLPTHFALRFRDALEEQGNRTVTEIDDIRNRKRAKIVKDPFLFNLNLTSIPDMIDKTEEQEVFEKIKSFITSVKQEELEDRNAIRNFSVCWSHLSSHKQKELLDEFYHLYYRSYCNSVMRFSVKDPKWNAYNGLNVLSDPYNKASQFMEASQYRHSLVTPVFPGNITGGGFNMNHYCPGVQFLRDMGFTVDQDDVNVRNARSCIPYNGFIPYWMMIYLKETFDSLSIPTSPLEMPWEMKNVLEEITPSKKQSLTIKKR